MTSQAKRLLRKIAATEEAASTVTSGQMKAAKELIEAGMAVAIPSSVGRGQLALTADGIEAASSEGE